MAFSHHCITYAWEGIKKKGQRKRQKKPGEQTHGPCTESSTFCLKHNSFDGEKTHQYDSCREPAPAPLSPAAELMSLPSKAVAAARMPCFCWAVKRRGKKGGSWDGAGEGRGRMNHFPLLPAQNQSTKSGKPTARRKNTKKKRKNLPPPPRTRR